MTADEVEDLEIERKSDTKYHNMEKEYEKKFDEVADKVAMQMGYRHIPWLGVTYFVISV